MSFPFSIRGQVCIDVKDTAGLERVKGRIFAALEREKVRKLSATDGEVRFRAGIFRGMIGKSLFSAIDAGQLEFVHKGGVEGGGKVVVRYRLIILEMLLFLTVAILLSGCFTTIPARGLISTWLGYLIGTYLYTRWWFPDFLRTSAWKEPEPRFSDSSPVS